jgi:hypothetical protein
MVSQRGQVKIADFGIALANADMNQKLTSAGEMVGTPATCRRNCCWARRWTSARTCTRSAWRYLKC